ncbi:hypothetical protein [Plantactinospora sp. KLBMP9567]|uniref:hypothetical protein n=1 Tax=Plantactinospora sp. KLBMP9567 TaxID=3085900 RepID=UPI0029829FFB|nr:hypothetical protein [Plantactinospora sp. KLBMP9567]MDW5329509.1 hypothetical protein [Plantactinospora sp. KLBMP9567]
MSTADGRRQLTVSINPWGDGDLDGPLADLLLAAFAEPAAATRAGTPLRITFPDRVTG